MVETTSQTEAKSTTGLISNAASMILDLLRKEVDLARAEMSENVAKAMVAVGLIVGGIVFTLVALNVLSAALVSGLSELFALEAGWSALIVGAVYLLIALILVRRGTTSLKGASLAPTRTVRSVREDAHVLKEKFHG